VINPDETLAPIFRIPVLRDGQELDLEGQIGINYEPLMRFGQCHQWWAAGDSNPEPED
jgi:hypothetical protein